jgi:hypothetical protein
MSYTANSTTYPYFNLSSRFSTTESTLCPITKYSISKVKFASSEQEDTDYVNWIGIGNYSNDTSKYYYFSNLVITDLTKVRDMINVTILASTGYVSSSTSIYHAIIEIKDQPNTPPFFEGSLKNEVFLNYSDGSTSTKITLPKVIDS